LGASAPCVKPAALIALGATAGRSLLQRAVTISAMRGRPYVLDDGTVAFVTIHPSFLLRIRDENEREHEFRTLVADLVRAKKLSG